MGNGEDVCVESGEKPGISDEGGLEGRLLMGEISLRLKEAWNNEWTKLWRRQTENYLMAGIQEQCPIDGVERTLNKGLR